MEDITRIEMNGYSFEHDMGIEARKEQRAIEYLTKQLDMNVPETVMKVYKQIISQKLFHTQVGYDFLKGLQNYLITNPEIDNAKVDTIEIDSPEEAIAALNAARAKRGEKQKTLITEDGTEDKKDNSKYKTRERIFMSTTIILGLTVIAMFIITLTAKVPTVLNYEKQLNDYYSQWEQRLTERENALEQKSK